MYGKQVLELYRPFHRLCEVLICFRDSKKLSFFLFALNHNGPEIADCIPAVPASCLQKLFEECINNFKQKFAFVTDCSPTMACIFEAFAFFSRRIISKI